MGGRLGEVIKLLRDQHGLSQREVGAALGGLSGSLIGQWESGVQPPVERVAALEVLFQCRPGELTKLIGWVPVDSDALDRPEAAIRADKSLDPDQKRTLLHILAAYRQPS